MKTCIGFILDKNKKISILVPDVSTKINYFYKPTEHLHKFDEATAIFINENNNFQIKKDTLDEILLTLNGTLKNVLLKNKCLPDIIQAGNAGYVLNNILNDLGPNILSPFWVWSSKHIQTLIYKSNNTIYLEIVPTYPWVYEEPKPGDKYISFDEFMKTYKPYAVEIISPETAQIWLNKCQEILDLIDCKWELKN